MKSVGWLKIFVPPAYASGTFPGTYPRNPYPFTNQSEKKERRVRMAITSYRQIPKFVQNYVHAFDMSPALMLQWLKEEETDMGLNLCPDFQRGHVWAKTQQSAYIEYIMRGGKSAGEIFLNCPWWEDGRPGNAGYQEYVCVDGLQRITAWRSFFSDETPIFGSFCSEIKGRFPNTITMRICINNLQTKLEVLSWYLGMNAGGTPHSADEIARVQALLEKEQGKEGSYGKDKSSI